MPPSSMGPFRHPFRPPAPHTSQSMMRLPNIPHDPYSQQPATPRPGMEQPSELHQGLRPPEPSAVSFNGCSIGVCMIAYMCLNIFVGVYRKKEKKNNL